MGAGGEVERNPINCSGSWVYACTNVVIPTHGAKGNHRNGGVPTQMRAWTANMKGKESLKGDAFASDLVKGRFAEGLGGWRLASGDQWKSRALECRTCDGGLLVCADALKAAIKVAQGAKLPTPRFTTNIHTNARIQELLKSQTEPFSRSSKWKLLHTGKFFRSHVNFGCFNHRWWVYF